MMIVKIGYLKQGDLLEAVSGGGGAGHARKVDLLERHPLAAWVPRPADHAELPPSYHCLHLVHPLL